MSDYAHLSDEWLERVDRLGLRPAEELLAYLQSLRTLVESDDG
ncbi:hypothetical protein [Solirubrobacter soli]|nr:hypothetical protein [Solirubrobacter soli]